MPFIEKHRFMYVEHGFHKQVDMLLGMPESIIAAAFSRIGQTVLHLDRFVIFDI